MTQQDDQWNSMTHRESGPEFEPAGLPGEPRRKFSIVTTIIAVNVIIFLLEQVSPSWKALISGVEFKDSLGCLMHKPGLGELVTYKVMQGQYWRLITAQYLHASFLHILLNMIGLHFLGRPLEQMWSARKFFTVYTVCGMAGNLFFSILGSKGIIDPHQPAVGASGSIYGLLGIVAVLFPHAEVYIYYLFPVKIRVAAVIMGVIAFMSVVERGQNYGGEACHLAGLAFGVWWALHGDEWWSHTEWALPGRRSRK
jgi:membrane associated rhomboid family serine protease